MSAHALSKHHIDDRGTGYTREINQLMLPEGRYIRLPGVQGLQVSSDEEIASWCVYVEDLFKTRSAGT